MSSIRGADCEIVSIPRIAKLLEETRVPDSVYTEREKLYCKDKSAQTAEELWTVKEAVGKALRTGFSSFTARDIEADHEYGQLFVYCMVVKNGNRA